MTSSITWSDHERWFAGFLEPLGQEAASAPMLVCFEGDTASRIVDSRPERPGEEVDPLTELAVIAAELRPDACVIALPVRVRDLDRPGQPTLARTWNLTSACFRGNGADLRVRQLPVGGVGSACDLDVEMSPVASVLDDAARHRLGEDELAVLYTACRWGHTLYTPGPAHGDAAAADAGHVAPDTVHDAEAARHRLRRHTGDLAARHRPLAGWEQVFDRPAVHADTPDGWLPACPL